jgi:hypothetical protein
MLSDYIVCPSEQISPWFLSSIEKMFCTSGLAKMSKKGIIQIRGRNNEAVF